MYSALRKLLFSLDPETAHELSLDWLGAAERLKLLCPFKRKRVSDPVKVMGLTFPNRVGMAAGLDKNADYFHALSALGFGFVEVGTITPRPQPGNPKPRLFRLEEHNAIINRMGFNNKGVEHLVSQVKKRPFDGILGINIGKNKDTPEEQSLDDYVKCMDAVYEYADYLTVNISSPNTPGLRNLQFGETLKSLLSGVEQKRQQLNERLHLSKGSVPIAVKIAPDMTDDEVKATADTIVACGLDAIIATNTTISRSMVAGHRHAEEMGGLSGEPVYDTSTHVVSVLNDHLKGEVPIIGVGGIMNGKDAEEKIREGASLVQLYTGFIHRGPALISEVAGACASAH